ncbi:DNA translocase FtsK [Candidatus Saccharibacteria bacterium]|nr:DNA translocase FtsK [Candidatus Saccharibacteria bacterium]
MPNARKPAKNSAKTKPTASAEDGGDLFKKILRQSLPLLAILLALFLILGRLELGGRLPVFLHDATSQAVGWLSWSALPAIIIYFAYLKARDIEQEISITRWLAAVVMLISLAGICHVFLQDDNAGQLAADGRYGGYLGYAVSYALKYPLNALTSFMVLAVVNVVSLFIVLNLSLKSLYDFVFNGLVGLWNRFFSRPEPVEEKAAPAAKPKPKKDKEFKLHKGVPVENSAPAPAAEPSASQVAKNALTVADDPDWKLPSIDILNRKQDKADAGDIQANAETIRETLANFNIDVEMEGANVGPRVTQYTLRPPSGIKLAKIVGLESNIALDLAASSIRIEAPIPGQRAVGIEVPNKKAATVRISSLFESAEWQNVEPRSLAFCIGKDIAGNPEIAYLEKMPHILLAGQTGSGKSVGINILLTSLLYRNSPSDLKLILVDPKQVELGPYNDIPHLLTPVINSPEKCLSALKWTVAEMERRLRTFAGVSKRNIAEFNSLKDQVSMPFIVVVIDELADLMMVASRDVESLIVRIAQKARAAGIHLVLATQRPSVDVITGLIKANVPARMAFTTASQVDSRTILDQVGAEKLLGAGDILYLHSSLPKPKRLQGAFMSDGETEKVCEFLRQQREVEYDSEVVSQQVSLTTGRSQVLDFDGDDGDDELFKEAVEVVVKAGKASTSLLQRRLRVGYARAARLIESLEEQGIIGPADGSRPREVLKAGLDDDLEDGSEGPPAEDPDGFEDSEEERPD